MTPALVEIIALALVKYGPELARALVGIFQTPNPTAADWEKIFKMAEKPYEDYTKPTPTPAPPPPA